MYIILFYLMHLQGQIKQLIRDKLPDWKSIDDEDILLQRMTGITNETYKVSVKSQSKIAPIIYRKFGQSTQNIFLQRKSEIQVYLHVSAEGNGPKIYYYDQAIRLEQYIQSAVLPAKKMLSSPYLQEVAFSLAKFHQLKPPCQKIGNKSLIKRVLLDGRLKILQLIHKKISKNIYNQQELQLLTVLKQWVSIQELNFIEKITQSLQEQELLFSHNDLLANNVLIENINNRAVFIDYEYSSYNYPIFDIANYICESEFDYDVNEPPYFKVTPIKSEDFEIQVRFVEAYVVSKSLSLNDFRANFQSLRKEQKYQAEIKRMVSLLPLGRMLCQFTWGWWAILVSKNPEITFDYLAYSKRRYDEYRRLKKQLTL